MASATPAGRAGEVVITISAVAADAVAAGGHGESQVRERRLNRFVRVVAFGEWAGNAFGALAFLWATAVLLGGFCSNLKPLDFWFATVIIFIEAFRIFSRNYKLENQSLFGTTRALRWLNVSFARMLGRVQEGTEVVLTIGLWINLVSWLPLVGTIIIYIIQAVLLIVMSKKQLQGGSQLTSRSRRCRRLQLGAIVISFLIIYALYLSEALKHLDVYLIFGIACASTEILTQVLAALLLIFRPTVVVNLTNTLWGRRLLSLAKVTSAVSLAFGFAALAIDRLLVDLDRLIKAFTVAVLSLGSLQTPAANNTLFGGRWIDVIMHVLFLWYLLFRGLLVPKQLTSTVAGISSILWVAVPLMENLQVPAAALQVFLSSLRFHGTQSDYGQPSPLDSTNPNLVPAIKVFYVLALCEGSLYIGASILGLFSFFPRRSLVQHLNLRGRQGAKAIDLYYQYAYATCMDTGPFAAKKSLSLVGFATESLSSGSSDIRLAALLVLGNLLQAKGTDSTEELRLRIVGSNNRTLPTLIGMLAWTDVTHRDVRLIAAKVIANLADRLSIAEAPGMLKLVSSLLDDGEKNEPAGRQDSLSEAASIVNGHGQHDNAGCWVRRHWQQTKKNWSVLEEQPLTHQDSLPILGMEILERLARDSDNCAEIAKATYLISKIVGFISYTTADSQSSNDKEQQHAVISSSLNFVRRLAITGESIGTALRQELCKNSFLLNNMECVLEDSRSSPEIMKVVFEILSKLAFDEDARKEIGSSRVTISKLMHAFIGNYYDQSLRMAAGEAVATLTIVNPANCLAMLEEPGYYELMKDLKNMLCEDDYRYVAASLLQNVCAHSTDKLHHHQGAGDHLSSAIPMLMENIMSAGGKQLEPLIGLASQISDVAPEPFVLELQLANGSDLVQKLVGTLNSNRKPNPEYPRMRRVVVEMVISIVKLCPRYAAIFREGGMMEALDKVERTPSKVEEYRVFYGNVGVVLESGAPLTALAATAKGLVHCADPALGD